MESQKEKKEEKKNTHPKSPKKKKKKKTKKDAKNPNPVKHNNRKHELKFAPVFVLYYSISRFY